MYVYGLIRTPLGDFGLNLGYKYESFLLRVIKIIGKINKDFVTVG